MHRNRDGSSGRISLSFLYVQRIAENWVWLSAFFFLQRSLLFYCHCICFHFQHRSPDGQKRFGDGTKKGREAICHLFVLVVLFCIFIKVEKRR